MVWILASLTLSVTLKVWFKIIGTISAIPEMDAIALHMAFSFVIAGKLRLIWCVKSLEKIIRTTIGIYREHI